MATQVTGAGGTTASFSNTPQAKDDTFLYSEDATGVLVLNVLANDLGGAAKQLYSIDNSIPESGLTATKTPSPIDLLTRDTTYSNDSAGLAGTTDTSLLGARIWMASDGTIHYDTASIAGQLQALSAGEVLVDKVTYAIQLGNGTLSWATATVQFTGTNDKPDIHLVTTDSAAASLIETNSALTKSGTLTVNDADVSDTVTASVASVSLAGTLGGLNSAAVIGMMTVSPTSLTANPGETNNLGWTFNSAPQAFDFLAVGETLTLTYTIKADDGHTGTDMQTVTITINGTNDAPDITVGAGDSATASLTETNAALMKSGTLTVNDADLSDTVTPSVTSVSLAGTTGGLNSAAVLGMLTASPASLAANPTDTHNLNWSFNSTPQAFDFLAQGETLTLTYTIKADDGHTGTDTQTVTVTITGTNDAATVSSDAKSVSEGDTAAALNTSGQLTITDPDTGEAHVVAQTNAPGIYGDFSIDANGAWTYAGNGAHNELIAGQIVTDTFTVTSQDGTATGTVTVTITGTNDAATVSSDAKSVSEGDTAAALNTSGQLTITDPDTGEAHVVAQTNAPGIYGDFSIDANGAWT
ncbi:VCBS domain-containing protein, partial [Mesorhizobium sp. CO1-1-11]|uniref:VCBS domain-containing protein n=1 Tax=Mesorhizobium sp. CO1-1-11 TaxID=2876636 RepID=UPI001CCFF082